MSLPERVAFLSISLRPFELADATEVERLLADPEVAEPTSVIPMPYLSGMAQAWIRGHARARDRGDYTYAITARGDDRVVGAIALRSRAGEHQHFGYWIGRPYWRMGYATQAVGAILALGFGFFDEPVLTASHLARNGASGRVMEKNGMSELRRGLRLHRGTEELVIVRGIERALWERRIDG